MAEKEINTLTEEFLMELYFTCLENDYILAIVTQHIGKDDLPDKAFVKLHNCMKAHYKEYKVCPPFSVLQQMLSGNRDASQLLQDIYETANSLETQVALEQLEDYIKNVKFQKALKETSDLFNRQGRAEAMIKLQDFAEWAKTFSLKSPEFVDVVSTFRTRFLQNRQKHNELNNRTPITRFYIDELDEMNGGRDLRTQLSCFMAATGVGKSHVARHVGANACQIDGLNVLHFQLEGSKEEAVNAYSASLVACSTFRYETGTIRDIDLDKLEERLHGVRGKLYVKSYPKFNCRVSTIDIKNGIADFKKHYKINPDIVIIDSADLLDDSSKRQWGENGERHKRIAVMNDLKDLAADENVWIVTTYQSTIENRDWLNDEKNVLTEFNSSEAKGIARPLTHLITLNQSDRERKEHIMRLYVAKSRFFEKGEPFRIATDYEHECFYDRKRSMNINKVS